ncbi:hypothetical protein D7030_04360 [Flavobacteriaceae bacterium AU392]|nr:hypothetical protein D1817_10835 [Flavobacteriaceae bacterium]RKM85910.1 hypothetical protein D7030_04360 [Flavobacteriaceae bacterium AU392]
MELNIINNKGVFEIHGHFVKENTYKVATYFSELLDTYYEIVICLKSVNKMDKTALNVMQFITNKAKRRSKALFVLGKNNTRIKNQFDKNNLNNIFRNDYCN